MSEWNMAEPQRQSPVGLVIYILRNFRAFVALFIAGITIGAGSPYFWLFIGVGIIPVTVILVFIAYYQYRNFTFQVTEDELIIHKGVIFKDRTVISVERIQSIQITDNIVQRILGLVSLKVDTAGSKGNELEIPALERKRADLLKTLLYEKKEAVRGEVPEIITETGGESAPESSIPSEPSRVLVHLSLFDLIKVGLTENHLKTGMIALAFVFGTWSQYQDFIEKYFSDYFDEYATEIAKGGMAFLLGFLLLYAIFSVLLSLGRTILRFYDLKATLHHNAVEIHTGLLKRNQDRVPIRKIQFVQWETNPLRRIAGYESAKIKPSNSVGETTKQQNIEIPALKPRESAILAEGIFPDYVEPEFGFKADAVAYARFNFIFSSFLVLPVTAVGFYFFEAIGLLALVAFIPFLFFGYQFGRRVRISFNRSFMVIRKGWIFPVRIVLPSHKLQSISFQQNVFLKKRGLCHLQFYTAAGSRTVRYLKEKEALELYNYLVFAVESSEESWM